MVSSIIMRFFPTRVGRTYVNVEVFTLKVLSPIMILLDILKDSNRSLMRESSLIEARVTSLDESVVHVHVLQVKTLIFSPTFRWFRRNGLIHQHG